MFQLRNLAHQERDVFPRQVGQELPQAESKKSKTLAQLSPETSLYDALNRLTSQQFSGIGTTQLRLDLTYTVDGQQSTLTRYSNVAGTAEIGSTTYTYDAVGRITDIQQRNGSGTVLETFAYSFDNANRVTTETVNGSTTTYAYDANNELTGDGLNTYTYDGTGNRTNTGYVTGTGNQLTNDGVYTYTYDKAGNLIEKSKGASAETWTYAYDTLNHLTAAKQWTGDPSSGGTLVEESDYSYDVFGNRIEETVTVVSPATTTDTRFALDGWKTQGGAIQATMGNENWDVWADLTSSNTLQTHYVRSDVVDQSIARVEADGTAAWYLTDRLESVRNLVDASGTLQDTISTVRFYPSR